MSSDTDIFIIRFHIRREEYLYMCIHNKNKTYVYIYIFFDKRRSYIHIGKVDIYSYTTFLVYYKCIYMQQTSLLSLFHSL